MKKTNLLLLIAAVLAVGAWYWSRQPRFIAGERAPDFTTTLADGHAVRLADFRGRYVLLQFWGSWCGPCRAENPHLVELYQKYHDRGFEIFSIGIERNAAAWQRAIAQDGLVWPWHAADLQEFDGPVARQYKIRQIPATYLINPEGVIMGANLSAGQLDKMLAGAFNSQ